MYITEAIKTLLYQSFLDNDGLPGDYLLLNINMEEKKFKPDSWFVYMFPYTHDINTPGKLTVKRSEATAAAVVE